MIEIFKTNVESSIQAAAMLGLLHLQFPTTDISFDLEDCDHVLRITGDLFCPQTIIKILADNGFDCGVLE
jgi:hypothetical protein